MCRLNVEVIVVEDDQLAAAWAVAVGNNGRRVLMARASAHPQEVAAGYRAALNECPIRVALGNHLHAVA